MNFDRDGACERVAGLVVASGAHLGAVFDPDGERLFLVDDEGAVLTDHESLLAFVAARVRPPARRPHRPARHRHRPRRPAWPPSTASTCARRRCRPPRWPTPPPSRASASPPTVRAASSCPGFLPAFDAAAAFVKMLDLLARDGRQLSDVRRGAARACTRPTRRW